MSSRRWRPRSWRSNGSPADLRLLRHVHAVPAMDTAVPPPEDAHEDHLLGDRPDEPVRLPSDRRVAREHAQRRPGEDSARHLRPHRMAEEARLQALPREHLLPRATRLKGLHRVAPHRLQAGPDALARQPPARPPPARRQGDARRCHGDDVQPSEVRAVPRHPEHHHRVLVVRPVD